ncbi:hypothetical protein PIB30_095170 [Stylosanthes scabra]|uniref:Uncharacterized protein n=1 Tax=Stylosanthes scabra TaxID=79078 RepID=A0ABU6XUX9_9FABA|nr:hypothetical protein [Stylosanthes scabra]
MSSKLANTHGLIVMNHHHHRAFPKCQWIDGSRKTMRGSHTTSDSRMEIVPPKYIGDGVLSEEKYPEFWRLIDAQGLRPFLFMRERQINNQRGS